MENILEIVNEAWGWTGSKFEKCLGENDFGNLILQDSAGRFWRFCPEELSIEKIADNRTELDDLSRTKEFYEDWQMENLVKLAKEKLGVLPPHSKYCLKIPGVLGGKYEKGNLSSIAFKELIEFSGHVANEIKDLPDGSQIAFQFTE